MPPELTPSDGGPVVVSSTIPLELSSYRLQGATFTAWSWASGRALVQVLEGEPGIRQINLLLNQPDELHFTDNVPALFLQFDLQSDYLSGTCNVTSRPASGESINATAGTSTRLELYFPDTTLRLMATHFKALKDLLSLAGTGQAAQLDPVGRPLTPAMLDILQQLFRTGFSPELGAMYRKERGMELLFAALELFS